MNELIQLIVSGAITGMVFSLIATGLTLSYTATGIFNLAYGGVAFSSAFLYYELRSGLGWHWAVALVVVVLVFAPLLGVLLNVAVFRPLARADEAAKVMATVGLLIALPALTQWVILVGRQWFDWGIPDGTTFQGIPPGIYKSPPKTYDGLPFDLRLNSNQVIVAAAAALVAVALWYLMRRTRIGLMMRSVVDRPALADLRGVSDRTTSTVAWVVGTVIASLAGVLGAPVLATLKEPAFTYFMFVAAAAVVLGGMRSIPLAFAAGAAIGVTQNLVTKYVVGSLDVNVEGLEQSVPFLLLLAGLFFIVRDDPRRAGSVADASPPPDYADDLARWRRLLPFAIAWGLLLVLIYSPWSGFKLQGFWLGLVITGLAYALIFQSFVAVTGIGGMVSLAQSALVVLAAVTVGRATQEWGLPFLPALLLGAAVATLAGVLVALPALRLGGLPLALATLSLGFICDRLLFRWDWLSHGPPGWQISRPAFLGLDLEDDKTMAMTLILMLAASSLLLHNLLRSASGRAITAVRNSEPAAIHSGLSVARNKLAVFAVASAIAGVGGVMLATVNRSITVEAIPTEKGLFWLAVVVLFGVRRPVGAIIAGLMVGVSGELFKSGWHFWESPVEKALWWGLVGVLIVVSTARSADRPGFRPKPVPVIAVLATAALVLIGIAAGWWTSSSFPSLLHYGGTGSGTIGSLFTSLLFGVGAIQLARDPDGAMSVTARQNRARRDARRRTAVGRAPLSEPVTTAPAVTSVPVPAAAPVGASAGARYGDTTGAAPAATGHRGLRLVDVVAGYGDVEVLHGVDLHAAPGRITAVFGPNGAGKSTTCLVAAGRLPLTSGAVLLGDEDVSHLPAWQRARKGLLLAPESRGVFPGLTVAENLEIWLPSSEARDKAYARFPVLGERRDAPAGALSGGEQQMLTLVPLLVQPPDLLIADEPTLGLAPLVVEEVLRVFQELRERGVALVLVEEKVRDVLQIADDVAFLGLGRMTWHGPRAEVDDDLIHAAYLGQSTPVG